MRTLRLLLLVIAVLTLGSLRSASAAPPEPSMESVSPDRFYRGRVLEVVEERRPGLMAENQFVQVVRLRIEAAAGVAQPVEAEFSDLDSGPGRRLAPGDRVVVAASVQAGAPVYYVTDRFRLPSLWLAFGLFFGLAVLFSRGRGVSAIIGLGITALVLARFIVPAIVGGANPLVVSLVGALIIALTSIYLAHGFNLRTTIALGATILTLVIAWGLAILFVGVGKLFGLGSEEAVYLQLAPVAQLNLRGLLLGGIILGALGVLDDITTAQAAAVDELRKANTTLSMAELYRRGLSVGTEHITSLVNTLFLAYAGASLPLFILFTIYNEAPLWVTLNSEFVAEEVIRTLVGSVALILAVPITTLGAATILSRRGPAASEEA